MSAYAPRRYGSTTSSSSPVLVGSGVGEGFGVGLGVGLGRGVADWLVLVGLGDTPGVSYSEGSGRLGPSLEDGTVGGVQYGGGPVLEGSCDGDCVDGGAARTGSGRWDQATRPLTAKADIATRMIAASLPGCARSSCAAHDGRRGLKRDMRCVPSAFSSRPVVPSSCVIALFSRCVIVAGAALVPGPSRPAAGIRGRPRRWVDIRQVRPRTGPLGEDARSPAPEDSRGPDRP